ncbi:hypothetical protein WA158_003339 [Blastocystis sp. Blastoise]
MQSNLGDSVTLYDILSRNQKKQSWDPWLPNSYICQDEQPVQPLAHDPNAQGSMYSSMAVQALRNHGQSPEDMFIATMNSAKANGDTARYSSMLSQWQTNYGIPTTSKIWYDASNPNNYQFETLLSSIQGLNGLNSQAFEQNKENYQYYTKAQQELNSKLNNIYDQTKTNNADLHSETASLKKDMKTNYDNLHADNTNMNAKMDSNESNRQKDNKNLNNKIDKNEKNRQNDVEDVKKTVTDQGTHYDILDSGVTFTIIDKGKKKEVVTSDPRFFGWILLYEKNQVKVQANEKGYFDWGYETMTVPQFLKAYESGFDKTHAITNGENDESPDTN